MTRPALTTLRSYELVVIGNYQKYRGGQTRQWRHETEININWITFQLQSSTSHPAVVELKKLNYLHRTSHSLSLPYLVTHFSR